MIMRDRERRDVQTVECTLTKEGAKVPYEKMQEVFEGGWWGS